MELDRINQKIIAQLQTNARMPTAEIGRRIGLSRTAVQERINRLESQELIQGYRVVLNEHAGLDVRALVFVKFSTKPCAPIVSRLLKIDGVTEIYSLAGSWDAIVKVACRSAEALSTLNDEIAADASVCETTSQLILSEHPALQEQGET